VIEDHDYLGYGSQNLKYLGAVLNQTYFTIDPIAPGVSMSDWIIVAFIAAIVGVAIFVVHYGLKLLGKRFELESYVVVLTRRLLISIIVAVAIIYLLEVLEVQVTPLLGGLGISSIIVALALQPVLGNLVGSVLLNGSRTFKPGDQIETNDISGTVVDINSRSVEIIDFDGVSNFIPNLLVLENPIRNRTSENIRRTVLGFQVSYDADLRLTQKLLQHAIRQIEGVTEIPTAEVLVQDFGESGVNLKALFWHPSEELTAQWNSLPTYCTPTIKQLAAAHIATTASVAGPKLATMSFPLHQGTGSQPRSCRHLHEGRGQRLHPIFCGSRHHQF